MTADIVNLRKARKAKARLDKERLAAENRAAFGRTKGQRLVEQLDRERARKALDAAQREPATGEGAAAPDHGHGRKPDRDE